MSYFLTKFETYHKIGAALLVTLFVVLGLGIWIGHHLAYSKWLKHQATIAEAWQKQLMADKEQLQALEADTKSHLQVVTHHIGKIEANLTRINALGEHLVRIAHLDPMEFNFAPTRIPLKEPSIEVSLQELDVEVARRFSQMSALHLALETRLGQKEMSLSGPGKPISHGWVSSFFGVRSDPFSGGHAMHSGVDIVGQEGSVVKALAAGVVRFANRKGHYGSMVEIQHANGLSTRYGHNKQLLVKPGQLVKKGQAIALLGSSGRSTGPHVHLEVHKEGRAVDPGKYFPELRSPVHAH